MPDTIVDTDAATDVEERSDEDAAVEVEDPRAVLELNDKYRRENKGLRDRLKETQAELEELRKAAMSEQERAIEEAKAVAVSEVESKYKAKLLEMSVRAAATGVLADPEDAWRLIDFEEVDPDDAKTISEAIAGLVEAKPYLAAVSQQRQRPSIDQGPQGSPPPPMDGGNAWFRQQVRGRR